MLSSSSHRIGVDTGPLPWPERKIAVPPELIETGEVTISPPASQLERADTWLFDASFE
jgi:hypothetical protein